MAPEHTAAMRRCDAVSVVTVRTFVVTAGGGWMGFLLLLSSPSFGVEQILTCLVGPFREHRTTHCLELQVDLQVVAKAGCDKISQEGDYVIIMRTRP